MTILHAIVIAAAAAAPLVATAEPPDAVLAVSADIDSARVVVDGVVRGVTPCRVTVAPGMHAVQVAPVSTESWLLAASSDSVAAAAGDTVRVAVRLLVRRQLVSEPPGVPVYAGDSLIGFTPLLLAAASAGDRITLRPPGTAPLPLPAAGPTGILRVDLPPGSAGDEDRVISVREETGGVRVPLVVSGGATILSGIAAAAWKVKADEVYAGYRASRDPAALDRTKRLDASAGIALAAMQVSLGLFVYFLLSDVP